MFQKFQAHFPLCETANDEQRCAGMIEIKEERKMLPKKSLSRNFLEMKAHWTDESNKMKPNKNEPEP